MTSILIAFGLSTIAQSETISMSSNQYSKDSASKNRLIADDPFLESIDSLHEAQIFNEHPITYNIRDLNIHKLPLDSIPVYSDSILQLRMQDMNAFSPIEFTFNSSLIFFTSPFSPSNSSLASSKLLNKNFKHVTQLFSKLYLILKCSFLQQ